MRPTVIMPAPRTFTKVAAVSLAGLLAAGCSSDVTRFASTTNPFSNPFQSEPAYTGSVSAAPSSAVSSAPLAPVGGGSYTPAAQPVVQQGTIQMGANSDWTINGGTPIVVGPGENLQVISTRYGVPAGAIVAANGLPATQPLTQGQRIVIPVYRSASAGPGSYQPSSPQVTASTTPSRPQQAQQQAARPAASGQSHVVSSGETLFSLARQYGVSHRDIAAANGIAPDAQLRIGQRVTIPGPGGTQVAAAPRTQPQTAAAPVRPAPPVQQAAVQPTTTRPAQPVSQAAPVSSTPSMAMQPAHNAITEPSVPAVSTSQTPQATIQPAVARASDAMAAATESGAPDFRWPVRGRVISGFGRKPDGSSSDGIKLAVPEGTPIRAAEGGTVAYSGSDLSEYGNLVLITHSNGWVTAYAHASELLVKKGDVVRRGQVIARAGRTGGVSAPQLHFEVRNGTSPVDPLGHLPRS